MSKSLMTGDGSISHVLLSYSKGGMSAKPEKTELIFRRKSGGITRNREFLGKSQGMTRIEIGIKRGSSEEYAPGLGSEVMSKEHNLCYVIF